MAEKKDNGKDPFIAAIVAAVKADREAGRAVASAAVDLITSDTQRFDRLVAARRGDERFRRAIARAAISHACLFADAGDPFEQPPPADKADKGDGS